MKPAALEAHKELAIGEIEVKLDKLLKAKGITFDQETAPVRNPEYRTLQALQRIEAKLALVMEAEKITDEAPVFEAAASPEPANPEAEPTTDAPDAQEQEPVEVPPADSEPEEE